jgi:hypothetical protein
MVFVMARPTRRQGSRFPYARKVVPKDVRSIIGKSEFKRPLRGITTAEIKRLHAEAMAEREAQIGAARSKLSGNLRSLKAIEIAALCGEYYRAELAEHSDDPGDEEGWDLVRDVLLDRLEDHEADEPPNPFEPQDRDLEEAESLLLSKGIAADSASIRGMAVRLWETKLQVAETMMRRALGDWGPDEYLPRFPAATCEAQSRSVTPKAQSAALTFAALLDGWAAERQPAPRTRKLYEIAFRHIERFLGSMTPVGSPWKTSVTTRPRG